MKIGKLVIGETVYELDIELSAEANAAFPESISYADLATMTKEEFVQIYDSILSHFPEKIR